jgi:hypothetical protein
LETSKDQQVQLVILDQQVRKAQTLTLLDLSLVLDYFLQQETV